MQNDRIDIWKIPLDIGDDLAADLEPALDDVERARARRFRFPVHRRRFLARRAIMRLILARYLGVKPRELRYDLAAHGKPTLCRATLDAAQRAGVTSDPATLRFNLSHSHELALLAIGAGHELGVDIEKHIGRRADRESAERFFADAEVDALARLTGDSYVDGFFKCWTSKEAFVKALGCGLSVDLDRFEVSVSPATPAALNWADPDLADAGEWTLQRFEPAEGYSGTIATRAATFELIERCFDPLTISDSELATLGL